MLKPADARGLNIRYSLVILLVTLLIGAVAFSGGAGFFRDTQSLIVVGVIALLILALSVGAAIRISAAQAALAALVGIYLLSGVYSIWRPESLLETLLLSAYLAVFFLGANVIGGGRKRLAVHFLVFLGATVAAVALYQYAIGYEAQIEALRLAGREDQARQLSVMSADAFGNFPTANGFAGWLILLIPAALGLLLFERDKWLRVWLGAAAAIMTAALYFSGSRAGVLALLVGLAAVFIFWAVRSRRGRLTAMLAPAGLALSVALFGWFFRFRPDAFMDAFEGRVEFWRAALAMVRDNPWFGVGPFGFGTAMTQYQVGAAYSRYAHNSYLQAAAETGWPGLLVLLVVIGLIFTSAWRRYRAADAAQSWLLLGLIGGLVAVIAHNLIDYTWHLPAVALAFWWMAALAVGDDAQAPAVGAAPGAGRVAGVALLILLLIPLVFVINSQSSGQSAQNGYEHYVFKYVAHGSSGPAAEERIEGVVTSYERALRFFPYDSNLYDSYANMIYRERAGGRGGSLKKAAALQRKAIAFRPTWPHYSLRLARIYEAQARVRDAQGAYERAVALGDKDPMFPVELGYFHLRFGRAAEALEAFNDAIALGEFYDRGLDADQLAKTRGDTANPVREIGRAYLGAAVSLAKLKKFERALKMIVQAERILGRTAQTQEVRSSIKVGGGARTD